MRPTAAIGFARNMGSGLIQKFSGDRFPPFDPWATLGRKKPGCDITTDADRNMSAKKMLEDDRVNLQMGDDPKTGKRKKASDFLREGADRARIGSMDGGPMAPLLAGTAVVAGGAAAVTDGLINMKQATADSFKNFGLRDLMTLGPSGRKPVDRNLLKQQSEMMKELMLADPNTSVADMYSAGVPLEVIKDLRFTNADGAFMGHPSDIVADRMNRMWENIQTSQPAWVSIRLRARTALRRPRFRVRTSISSSGRAWPRPSVSSHRWRTRRLSNGTLRWQ